MDPNITVLLILLGVAVVTGVVVAGLQSQRIREHGLIGTLRRAFSYHGSEPPMAVRRGGDRRSPPRTPGNDRRGSGRSS